MIWILLCSLLQPFIYLSASHLCCLKTSDSWKILLQPVAELEFKPVSFIIGEAVLTIDDEHTLLKLEF